MLRHAWPRFQQHIHTQAKGSASLCGGGGQSQQGPAPDNVHTAADTPQAKGAAINKKKRGDEKEKAGQRRAA